MNDRNVTESMTCSEAFTILTEFNHWRRGEGTYAWNEDPAENPKFPFTPEQIGQAIDVACDLMDRVINLK